MANGHGGKRRDSGRPLGARTIRPYGIVADVDEAHAGMLPTQFEGGDSLEFLAMQGKIWPTGEQIYAAKSVLPIEHPPALTVDGRSVEEIKRAGIAEYLEQREADDPTELIVQRLRRLREETAPSERPRHTLEAAFKGDTGGEIGEEDQTLIDEICARLDALHPSFARVGEIIPPQPEPTFRKRQPATIDGEVVRQRLRPGDEAPEVIEKPGVSSVSNGATDRAPMDRPTTKAASAAHLG
jgi:hypothetical protein